MHKIGFLLAQALLLLGLNAPAAADADRPRVRMQTSMGAIVMELDRAKAPITVDNFLAYLAAGFYEGTVFHRVIDGFMIQGGGFDESLAKKPTRAPIRNEADNGLKNARGTVAMARTNAPHSASSQFFINLVDNDSLDHRSPTSRGWGYAVFGRVVEGMDVVDRIAKVPTGSRSFLRNVPKTNVVIEKATLDQPATDEKGAQQ